MEAGWLARMRWRRRGAWLWPTFVVVTVLDGVIMNAQPMTGEGQSVPGGVLLALVLNLIGVVLVSWPLGMLLRRRRRDLPVGVARDYAGTTTVLAIAAAFVIAGVLHRPVMHAHRRALQDAIVRAQAFIGDHAPAPFRDNVEHTDTFAIVPGSLYRTCVPNPAATSTYCVVVRTALPLATSVTFAGYEPNSMFSQGVN